MSLPKFANLTEANELLGRLSDEFAVVQNPSYVHPPFELYPLPPKRTTVRGEMAGAVMDMDGTTTTTEPLCLHSLETMVRRITGRAAHPDWAGLDRNRDYPHIIGNSTTKHVEYLVRTYADEIDPAAFRQSYLQATAWTLEAGRDEGRKADVRTNLAAFGLGGLVEDQRFREAMEALAPGAGDSCRGDDVIAGLAEDLTSDLDLVSFDNRVRAAVDVYYHRYHEILGRIAAGQAEAAARDVFGAADRNLILPMPGIGVFLALVRGLLGEDAAALVDPLAAHLVELGMAKESEIDGFRARLATLGTRFEQRPAKVAIVTSSIRYEADIVLAEVFRVLHGEMASWPLPAEKRDRVLEAFSSHARFYDGFITASDSSEIRLKPHRDLYAIALHRMGIAPGSFDQVAGFEDSESGTIAIRAAGIGCCCALPFPETTGHDFRAASVEARGGIPEVILRHNAFLDEADDA